MKRFLIAAMIAASTVAVPALSGAAEKDQAAQKPATRGMHGMQGMEGMQGMMEMMNGCNSMMKGSTPTAGLVPSLPPGNEKLQAQMQAEIMQKAGEIAGKYASQAK